MFFVVSKSPFLSEFSYSTVANYAHPMSIHGPLVDIRKQMASPVLKTQMECTVRATKDLMLKTL